MQIIVTYLKSKTANTIFEEKKISMSNFLIKRVKNVLIEKKQFTL
jgi:hypothetical protein